MTGDLLRLGLLDLLLAAVGWTILRTLNLVPATWRPHPAAVGFGFFVGWAVVGLALTVLAVVGVPPGIPLLLAVAGVVGAAAWFAPAALRRRFDPPPEPLTSTGWGERVVAIGGAIILSLSLLAAAARALWTGADTNWDVWAFWLPKARAIHHFGGLDTGAGGITSYPNPEYPPLQPVMDSLLFDALASPSATLVPLNHVVLAIGFFAAVAALLRHRVRPVFLWPSLALLAAAPGFTKYLESGLADPPVAYLLALAGITGALWTLEREPAWLALSGTLAAAAALTKSEGLLLALPLGFFLVLVALVERRRWRGPVAAALAPVAIALWKAWLIEYDQPLNSVNYRWSDLLEPQATIERLDRLQFAVEEMAEIILSARQWLLLVPLVLAASVFLLRRRTALTLVVVGWLATGFLGLATVYWIGTPPIAWYVETSADRVLISLGTFAGAMLPLVLSEISRFSRSP